MSLGSIWARVHPTSGATECVAMAGGSREKETQGHTGRL